jgi:methionine-rich copper-binding protein CopC
MMRQFPVPRRWAVFPAVAFALLLLPTAVTAHAELVKSTPKDGATLDASPSVIFATYSEAMDPSGSSLKLVDKDDKPLATGGVDPDNDKRMSIDDVPDLAPGSYTVKSTTKSDEDGDIDRKEWSFTVKAVATPSPTPTPAPTPTSTPVATAAPTAAPTQTPSAAPSASPSPSESPSAAPSVSAAPTTTDGGDASGGGDVLLPIIVAAVIVAVVAGYLYSRRERPPTQV